MFSLIVVGWIVIGLSTSGRVQCIGEEWGF